LTRYYSLLFLVALLCGPVFTGTAQKKDSTYVGLANGLVRDSVHNYVLQSATVSIYRASDSRLVSYQLSNNFGKFSFAELPVGVLLKAVVSYIGYQSYRHEFLIPADTRKVEFKPFQVLRADNELQEVAIVAKPPMQMNGDTLEINADAFTLDTNAVAEDLLRAVKGITIWGDGKITVNGKTIRKLTVNGKEFFGSDPKVALQNLPKNAIEKVQVYKEGAKTDDIEEPPMSMNIVLKKGKDKGMFGKIGAGYGTREHYAADGMLSAFSPKTQFSMVGSANNVNKAAYDITTLMNYSSFKGEGIDHNYQPDFSRQGLNTFHSAGFTYSHDFLGITTPQYSRAKTFRTDYLFNDTEQKVLENLLTVVSLNGDEKLLQDKRGTSNSSGLSHRSTGNFDYKSEKKDFMADFTLQNNRNEGLSTQDHRSLNSTTGEESRNRASQAFDNKQTKTYLKAAYASRWYYKKNKRKSVTFNIDYAFDRDKGDNISERITNFTSLTDPDKNQYFNRQYDQKSENTTHTSNFSTPNLIRIFKPTGMNRSRIELKNTLNMRQSNIMEHVADLDTLSRRYTTNDFLTNKSSYRTLDERPGLTFSRSFEKALDNRYRKTLRINLTGEGRFFRQKNSSDKAFQKIDRTYSAFLPSANISYTNSQSGEYESSYSLKYVTSTSFPGVDQLAPLVDSANVFYLHLGNPNLESTYKHELNFGFQHFTVGTNTFSLNTYLRLSTLGNYIADSSNYDALGRNIHYFANASGNRNLEFSNYLSKVFKMKAHQVQLSLTTNLFYYRNPLFINGEPIHALNIQGGQGVQIGYSFKDLFKLTAHPGITISSSRRKNTADFNTKALFTTLAAGVNLPGKIYITSNINYSKNTSSYSKPVNYAIWNANLGWRFMKGNNGELKFSALDLLRQNTSVVNYANNNSITRGTVNVLQQYFMVTLAYFPRKFGSTEAKKK